ncbi:MAG: hypothetical protein ACTSSB_06895 [Candidatus Heimdallarchaeota archaeon]
MSGGIVYHRCPKCRADLAIMDGIYTITCNKCGANLRFNPNTVSLEIIGKDVRIFSGEVEGELKAVEFQSNLGKKRIYILYLLFGIVTLGIGFVVYLNRNLSDLGNHETFKEEVGAQPILSEGEALRGFKTIMKDRIYYSPWYLGLFALITIAYDLLTTSEEKYSSLYYHLVKQPEETAPYKSPHPRLFLVSLILFIISSIVVIVTSITGFSLGSDPITIVFYVFLGILCISFFILVMCGALWQRAFNEHIEAMRSFGYE